MFEMTARLALRSRNTNANPVGPRAAGGSG